MHSSVGQDAERGGYKEYEWERESRGKEQEKIEKEEGGRRYRQGMRGKDTEIKENKREQAEKNMNIMKERRKKIHIK